MTTLTIRNLDGLVKQRLRARAAANGRSMEEEARIAIREHVAEGPPGNLYDTLRKRFEPLGGVDLEVPARSPGKAMDVSVSKRWEDFIEDVMKSGRYGSASEIVREGLRLVEEREAKLRGLRDDVQAALDDPRRHTWDEVDAAIEADLDELERRPSDAAE